MNGLFIEHFGDVHLYFAMGVKIVFAIFLGGLVGLDREKKMKSAGGLWAGAAIFWFLTRDFPE